METSEKQFHWNTENPKNRAYRSTKIVKTLENSTDKIESRKVYAFMKRMYSNEQIPRRDFRDNLQLINWTSGVTCHTTPEILYFILGSLGEQINILNFQMDISSQQNNRRSPNKMRDNNGNPFIATL